MRPQVLAAHLNPGDRTLLLECFGIEYMNTCSDLMTLDWLRAKKVADNLRRAFGIEVGGAAAHAAATPGAGD